MRPFKGMLLLILKTEGKTRSCLISCIRQIMTQEQKNRSELYLKYDDSLNISVEYTRFYITEILIISTQHRK